jgi:hypothetical protein
MGQLTTQSRKLGMGSVRIIIGNLRRRPCASITLHLLQVWVEEDDLNLFSCYACPVHRERRHELYFLAIILKYQLKAKPLIIFNKLWYRLGEVLMGEIDTHH